MAAEINDFLEQCSSCGVCKEGCPFLTEYGTPAEIISQNPKNAFYCANCMRCSSVCPQGLSPADALHAVKHGLMRDALEPERIKQSHKKSLAFALRGHRLPFSHYPSAEVVFWPGCGLSGSNPEIVKKTTALLSEHMNKKVGIALDCCFDPVYQAGDSDETAKAAERIKGRLKKMGIKEVITGCTNCRKIFSIYMPDFNAKHVLEILPKDAITSGFSHFMTLNNSDKVYLHHPCPSYRFDGLRKSAKWLLPEMIAVTESQYASCCGLGGELNDISPKLSEAFAENVIAAAGDDLLLTYCMGCKGKFLSSGKKAYHLLEFISGVQPAGRRLSPIKKWFNRFMLSITMKISPKFLMAVLLIFLIILASYLRHLGYISTDAVLSFIDSNRVFAPLLYIIIYSIVPSLFIPSLPMTIGAGFLWGPFWGVVFAIVGATIGASASFFIARYVIGDSIRHRFSYALWQRLQDNVNKHGWKAVAFARIVPVFPFPVLNYLFGVTPISFKHYLWSTFIFMLPACIAYVAFGSSMGELILKGDVKGIIIGILIAGVALLLPFAIKPLFKKITEKN
jgi:uncharacterized membrane protein YdjX (TVP38/TMEM64 family)/Fe-S oxidoreductase